VTAVLTGHSERRHQLGEADDFVGAKSRAVLGAGLRCVLCVGEKLEERQTGRTDSVNERQLRIALADLPAEATERLIVAYEPVWAIGTGKTATPADAQDAHAKIRRVLADIFDQARADRIRVIYGGSVNAKNAAELLAQPDVDGGLIGGASLKAEDFVTIVRAAGG
jgi:triosephosphate isomerase